MATMRTCPFTLGLLGVTDLGPSCWALNATAAFAGKPCWTGSSQSMTGYNRNTKGKPISGRHRSLTAPVAPGLPRALTARSLESHNHLRVSPNLLSFLSSLRVSLILWSEGSGSLSLTPSPFSLTGISPNQFLAHLFSSCCLLL